MNCLAVLIRTRPPIANKILSTVLNYNPMMTATTQMTPRQIVILKSLERTTRALLRHVLRVHANHPMEQKIVSYLSRLQQTRTTVFSDSNSLKRPAEPTDGLDEAKRQRLTQNPRRFPPMPPPPNSYAQLYTLTEDSVLQQFDVKLLPAAMVSDIVGLLLQHVDSKSLDESIDVVRQRYEHIQKITRPSAISDVPLEGPTGIDDEDDYDPEGFAASFSGIAGESQVSPATEKALSELAQPMIDLGSFELAKPPPLSVAEIAMLSDTTFNSVFDIAKHLERSPALQTNRQKSGLNRLAASSNDALAWITVLCRLAARAPAGLDELVDYETKDENDKHQLKYESSMELSTDAEKPTSSNRIRHALFSYILDDWRSRLNVAISWLTEEWYADKVAWKHAMSSPTLAERPSEPIDDSLSLPNYTRALDRLLTHLIPRFDASDSKLLIRFLSEIPHLSPAILHQIRQLAFDPVTMKICILSMQYLVMFRPPARTMVLDCLESIWREGDDGSGAKVEVGKVLKKWRPGSLEQTSHQIKPGTPADTKMDMVISTNGSVRSNGKTSDYKNATEVNMKNTIKPDAEYTVQEVTANLDPRRRG